VDDLENKAEGKVLRLCYLCEGEGVALYLTGWGVCKACQGSGVQERPTPAHYQP
jgi:hypothetical protein